MARPAQFLRWQQTLSTYLPHLSRPQVTVLALWSLGLILAHSCGLTTVATVVAYLLARREGAVREQLRDWYREAPRSMAPPAAGSAAPSRSAPALRRCCAGSWPGGSPPVRGSPWRWTPRPSASASPF
jgi:hypothetical protein